MSDDTSATDQENLTTEDLWDVIDMLVDTLEVAQDALQNGFSQRAEGRLNAYLEVAKTLASVPTKPGRPPSGRFSTFFRLNEEKFNDLQRLLGNPPEPNEALRALMNTQPVWWGGSSS